MKRILSFLLCILLLAALPLSAAGAQSSAAEERDTGLYLLTPKLSPCITASIAGCADPYEEDGFPSYLGPFTESEWNGSIPLQENWVWSGNDASLWGHPFTLWNTQDAPEDEVQYFVTRVKKGNRATHFLSLCAHREDSGDSDVPASYVLFENRDYKTSTYAPLPGKKADWVNELALFPHLGPENPLVPVRSAAGLAVISLDGTVLRTLYIEPNHCAEEAEEAARQFLSKQKAQLKKDGQCVAINVPLSQKALCNPYSGTPVSKEKNDELNALLQNKGWQFDEFTFFESTAGTKPLTYRAMNVFAVKGGECVLFAEIPLSQNEQDSDTASVNAYARTETKSWCLPRSFNQQKDAVAQAVDKLDLERFRSALWENTVDFARTADTRGDPEVFKVGTSEQENMLNFKLAGWSDSDELYYTAGWMIFEKSADFPKNQMPFASVFAVARYELGKKTEDVKPVYYLTVHKVPATLEEYSSGYFFDEAFDYPTSQLIYIPVYATRFYLGSSISLKKVLSLIRTANSLGKQG